VTDIMAGNVDLGVLAIPSALAAVQSGKITALAVTDMQRSSVMPNVPSLSDYPAFKGFDTKVWYALQGPPNLPQPIVTLIGDNVRALMKDEAFLAKMHAQAITPARTGTASEFVDLRATQHAAFKKALGQN
jgi:tripartite-type tricarboxylate transporter receptor subunit TctC